MWHSFVGADRLLGARIAAALATSPLDSIFLWASVIGTGGAIWLAMGLVAWMVTPSARPAVWRLALSIGLSVVLANGVFKPLVDRARPFTNHPEAVVVGPRPDSTSFPSGHSANAAAGATALSRLWPAAALPLWTLALTIALSRVALGVHFPIDVLSGLLLGYAVARFVCARPPQVGVPTGARAPSAPIASDTVSPPRTA